MAANELVFLSEDLRSTREIPLPGDPSGLAVVSDTAYVSLAEPMTLVIVRYEKALYLSCPGKKTFGVIRDGKPIVAYKVDGFPISVAGPL